LVVDAETGKVVFERDADRLFAPASVTKIYTCASALAALGADFKFETPVVRRGEVKDGRLRGDLILVASGDVTLGGRTGPDGKMLFADSDHTYADAGGTKHELTPTDPLAGLTSLAKQIAAVGVKRVEGEILIDDRLFASDTGSGSGPRLITPIIVNDNVIDLTVTPADAVGKAATVRLRPEIVFAQVDTVVETVEADRKPNIEVTTTGPQRVTVRGRIPLKSKPLVRVWPVDDPKAFARTLFIDCLRREGVLVSASAVKAPTADLPERDAVAKLPRIAVFTSPPLSEAVKVTLKVSQNLYASTLPLVVASKRGGRTLGEGLKYQGRFLKEVGVPVETISFAGGAGGMNADAATPRATVDLLRGLRRRPEYAALHAGLPVLGVDGTLADVIDSKSPARGKAQAKTGTLYWADVMNGRSLLRSKALAGTLTTAKGTQLVIAMFVNDVPLPAGVTPIREGKVLGRLCEIVHQHGP
jgi:serine-type D-Ala-D-Ala carboxypeptidase/endopeptidase (penicillin-binding protein 4)